jgi:hypothetical protein
MAVFLRSTLNQGETMFFYKVVLATIITLFLSGFASAQITTPTVTCPDGTVLQGTVCNPPSFADTGFSWVVTDSLVTFTGFVTPAGYLEIGIGQKGGAYVPIRRQDTGSLNVTVPVGCGVTIAWRVVATLPNSWSMLREGDTKVVTTPPCVTVEARVARMYLELLGRVADYGGLNGWVGQWYRGEDYVRQQFVTSPEHYRFALKQVAQILCRPLDYNTESALADVAVKQSITAAHIMLVQAGSWCGMKGGAQFIGDHPSTLSSLPDPVFH